MVKELVQKVNGLGKIFLAALLGAALPTATILVKAGSYVEMAEETKRKVTQHVEKDTQDFYKEFVLVREDVAVCKSEEKNLKEQLARIETQYGEIARLLRSLNARDR